MQLKKEYIEQSILEEARDEFVQHGFQAASMRAIAKRAQVTLSNIYNYFANKDALFRAVLQPILADIERGKIYLQVHEQDEHTHMDFESHLELMEGLADYLTTHRTLLHLLAFQSTGSSLAGYKDELVDWYTEVLAEFVPHHSLGSGPVSQYVSAFMVHNVASFWFNFGMEALMHDLSREELLEAARETMAYAYYGWQGLICWKRGLCVPGEES